MISRLLAFVSLSLVLSSCLQPMRRYNIGPIAQRDDSHIQVARALTAAGLEIDEADPQLGKVTSTWVAPFGNDWRRRFVAIIDDQGHVSLRVEVKICSPYEPCVPLQEAASQDLDALDAVARQVGESLHAPIGIAPAL